MREKRDVIVLNGMSGAAAEARPLAEPLQAYGRIWLPDIIGHGGRPLPERFTVQAACADLVAFMDRKAIPKAAIVGFSMGGMFGLYLARHWPDRITGVCTIAMKYFIDRATSDRWLYLGDPERIAREGNTRARELELMHRPQDWRQVYAMNRRFYRELPDAPPLVDADLRAIRVPVKVMSGEQDPIVQPAEQEYLAAQLGVRAQIWPGAMHPLHRAPLGVVVEIGHWIRKLPGGSETGTADQDFQSP